MTEEEWKEFWRLFCEYLKKRGGNCDNLPKPPGNPAISTFMWDDYEAWGVPDTSDPKDYVEVQEILASIEVFLDRPDLGWNQDTVDSLKEWVITVRSELTPPSPGGGS
jgi:hypothetical protein